MAEVRWHTNRIRPAAFTEMLEVIAKSYLECAKTAQLSAGGCAHVGCPLILLGLEGGEYGVATLRTKPLRLSGGFRADRLDLVGIWKL